MACFSLKDPREEEELGLVKDISRKREHLLKWLGASQRPRSWEDAVIAALAIN